MELVERDLKGYIEKNANAAGVCFSGISNKLFA